MRKMTFGEMVVKTTVGLALLLGLLLLLLLALALASFPATNAANLNPICTNTHRHADTLQGLFVRMACEGLGGSGLL